MRTNITLFFALFLASDLLAQGPGPGPCPGGSGVSDNCATACISCNFVNGTSNNTGDFTADFPPEDCLAMHNNFWYAFVAGQTTATFTGTPTNCSNQGIQMALYGQCDGPCLYLDYGCAGPTSVVTFTADLVIGQTYYLVVDGCSGDICDVELNIDPIEAVIAPSINNTGPVLGPSTACPNGTVTYCLDEVYGASQYIWNIPADATINGIAGPGPITLAGSGANCAEIKFGASVGNKQICVRPVNFCSQGQQKCKTINVQKIPDTVFPPANVCIADADAFMLPWGNPISSNPGTLTYQATFPSYLGCDSIVKQTVTVVPPKVVNLTPKTLCKGECLTVGTETYCETGTYVANLQSAQGCDSVVNFSITLIDLDPQITFAGNISCTTPTITLHSTPQAGAIKSWKNTAGQNLGVADSLVVSVPGDYFLTVTLNSGGTSCSLSDTVTVTGNATIPTLTAMTTGYLGCTTTSVQLDALTNGANPVYAWTGPGGFNSNIANPAATLAGTYNVTVTAANGCTANASTLVQSNTTPPTAQALGDTLTCIQTIAPIQASSDAPAATFLWSGPNGFQATTADTSTAVAGTYNVTVTNPANGCTSVASTLVVANTTNPDLSTAVSGPIGCPTPVVTVSANTQAGISFNWSGPAGFSAALPAPGVSQAGLYAVTVTGANGCTSTGTATVTGDTNPPDATAAGGTLSCTVQSLLLDGNSNTPGAGFAWSGPGSFTSAVPDPQVNLAGDYILTVTGPNGCVALDTAIVLADVAAPDAAATGGIISCAATQTSISASSTTPGAVFQWTGPGNFSSPNTTASVSLLGNYLLTVTAPNGCIATAVATVLPDADIPNIAVSGDTLTCSVTTVLLDGGSSTPGVTFAWSGPNSFTAATEDVNVGQAGDYTLTVTDPTNGCKAVAGITLPLDDAAPGVTAIGGTLACSTPTLVLQGSSPTTGVNWSWSGPGGFVSNSQNPVVSVDGLYSLSVTNPANGCSSTATALVQADLNAPQASATAGTLTCAQTTLALSGNASVPGTFSWTGPNGFVSSQQNPTVNAAGTYTLTVVAQNGCTDTAMTVVAQNTTAPDVTALGDTIDCISGQAVLSAGSLTPGVTWTWSGPNNFSSSLQNPAVTVAGLYVLTATAPNGCTATTITTVELNNDAPVVSIGGVQTLTCSLTTVVLTVSGMGPGVTGQWGDGTMALQFNATTPGDYTFTATGPNGCIAAPTVTVPQNIQPPQNVTASGGLTDCDTQVITITGNSGTPGVSWQWSGPGNFSSTAQNPNNVTAPGAYTLVVTDPANGCTTAATAQVTQDLTAPVVSLSADSLTCSVPSVAIQTESDTPGAGFQWSGPGGFSSVQEDPAVSLPGLYTLIATAGNGCTTTAALSVHQNILPPGVNAAGDTITCSVPTAQLQGSSAAPGATFAWSGPNNFSSALPNPTTMTAGNYQLTATGTNGCTSVATAIVSLDSNVPLVTAGGGTITCTNTTATLSAGSSLAGTWQWTGPNNFSSTLPNPVVSAGGVYTVTGTSPNGCTGTATATVVLDTQTPVVSIAAPGTLDCTTPQVTLTGSVQGAGAFGFQWSTTSGQIVSGANASQAVVNAGGPYVLTVANLQNGCTAAQTTVVPVNPNTPTQMLFKTVDVTCFGAHDGRIEIASVTGGTLPLLYSLDGAAFTVATSYQGLAPGQHQVRLQDAAGCELEAAVFIQEPGPLSVTLGADTTLHLGEPILLPVLGAINDPLRVTQISTQPFPLTADTLIYPMRSFIYSVSVSDSNNCTASDNMRILVDRKRLVYIPNVFNPDATNNAVFQIFGGIDVRKVRSFRIYDRWGELVHQAEGFTPDDISAGWDGTVKGEKAVPAVFTYFAEIEFIDGETELYTGDVTLVRN